MNIMYTDKDIEMNRQDLVNILVEEEDLYPALADRVIDRIHNSMLAALLSGDRVLLNKIGCLRVVDAQPRMGRNVKEGTYHPIPARRRLKLKTSAILRRLMNEKVSVQ